MEETIQIDIQSTDAYILVKLKGFIDLYNVGKINEQLSGHLKKEKVKIILDIEEVEHIDSSGFGLFLTLLNQTKKNNGSLIILKPSQTVSKMFLIAGVLKFFQICESFSEVGSILNLSMEHLG